MGTLTDQQLASALSLWHSSESEERQAFPREKVISYLSHALPDFEGGAKALFEALRHDRWIVVDDFARYVLSQRGEQKYRQLQEQGVFKQAKFGRGHLSLSEQWMRFRKLLTYYISCVHHDARKQEFLRRCDYRKNFLVPQLGTVEGGWLKPLTNKTCVVEVSIPYVREDQAALDTLWGTQDWTDEGLYIGYPLVQSVDRRGMERLLPIFLIPVEMLPQNESGLLRLKLHLDDADFNDACFGCGIGPENSTAVTNALAGLHTGDSFYGCVDVYAALPTIEAQFNRQTLLDPQHLEAWPLKSPGAREYALRNSAVFFFGNGSRYNNRLVRELRYIRDFVSDEDLDKTALAYVFREEPLVAIPPREAAMPIPFLAMNQDQRQAVSVALNMPVSKITGPPGTGKSQVAVNLICNLLCRNRSVLFTSMNHKAVYAIHDRIAQEEDAVCKTLPSKDRLSLVTFCKKEDGSTLASWPKQDVNVIGTEYGEMQSARGEASYSRLLHEEEYWRAIEQQYAEREEVKQQFYTVDQEVNTLAARLHVLSPHGESGGTQVSNKELTRLRKVIPYLVDDHQYSSWSARWLKWWLFERRKECHAREYMLKHYPQYCRRFSSYSKLRSGLASYVEVMERYSSCLGRLEQLKEKVARLPKVENAVLQLGECMNNLQEHKDAALGYAIASNGSALAKDKQAMKSLRGAMDRLDSSGSAGGNRRRSVAERHSDEQEVGCLTRLYPAWAVTMLSLTHASPCVAGYFDHVIIDEASQCMVPPVIPALFRAKAVTLIGDPNQFPPVITMKPFRHDYLRNRAGLDAGEASAFNFLSNSAYSVLDCESVLLREHFRCTEEIAEYFNSQFYRRELIVCSDEERLKKLRPRGFQKPIEWRECINRGSEIEEVCRCVNQLQEEGYSGSIGVLTILREDAENIEQRLNRAFTYFGGERLAVSTANGFQGGERDILFLVLGYQRDLSRGKRWYFEAPEHRYIYNVAISRAKACLVLVGNREYCRTSPVEALRALAALPYKAVSQAAGGNGDAEEKEQELPFDSIWEEKLYHVLSDAGVETIPQYRIMGRRLDLAYVSDKVKIDIEVDGVRFHASPVGGRKLDDEFRDLEILRCGWMVQRFWVYELKDDMEGCVKTIKKLIARGVQ